MKKAQAILPFFAVQLICIMIFFIVLLSMLSLNREVRFTLNEFDQKTASLLALRRLVSSADCLAAENHQLYFFGDQLYSGSQVRMNVIDYDKLIDPTHFNCMRMDNFDSRKDILSGVLDAKYGTGYVFNYNIQVYDLVDKSFIKLYSDYEDKIYSSVARSSKTLCDFEIFYKSKCKETECYDAKTCNHLEYTCNDSLNYTCLPYYYCGAKEGTLCCASHLNVLSYIIGGCSNRFDLKSDLICGETNSLCRYFLCDKSRDEPHTKDTLKACWDTGAYYWYPNNATLFFNPSLLSGLSERGGDYFFDCSKAEDSQVVSLLTILKKNNEYHPALFILRTCFIKGENWKEGEAELFKVSPTEKRGDISTCG